LASLAALSIDLDVAVGDVRHAELRLGGDEIRLALDRGVQRVALRAQGGVLGLLLGRELVLAGLRAHRAHLLDDGGLLLLHGTDAVARDDRGAGKGVREGEADAERIERTKCEAAPSARWPLQAAIAIMARRPAASRVCFSFLFSWLFGWMNLRAPERSSEHSAPAHRSRRVGSGCRPVNRSPALCRRGEPGARFFCARARS
jgi:hypothetical protein